MMKINEIMPLAFGFELLLAIGIGTLVLAGLAAFLMLTFYRKVEKDREHRQEKERPRHLFHL